jgi:predicted Zn-dependent protease
MICSSTTTCRPDRKSARRIACAGLSLGLAAALLAAPGVAGQSADVAEQVLKADADLARGDGIAAEVRLKQALARGADRTQVAALMGEALIDQRKPEQAKRWLAAGQFSPQTAARGFRALAHLERLAGNLPGAGHALDQAKAIAPGDASLWVEIASLRYAGGEHQAADEAADHALSLDPRDVRALVFKGMLVRDRFGLTASLPWFETALTVNPGDMQVLGEYAATLGDLGRAREMLVATRRMITIDAADPRAFYLQAVLAARAGNVGLARRLMTLTKGRLKDQPGAMLLTGALEMQAGNLATATDILERLVARQPANVRARHLLARAISLGGNDSQVIARFSDAAARGDASPYLLTLVARAYENLGQRDLAAPLLERAASDYTRAIAPVVPGSDVGVAIASGNASAALTQTAQWVAENPGNSVYQSLAGDAELAMGRPAAALEHYRSAARVRTTASLLIRMSAALEAAGKGEEAAELVEARLVQDPANGVVVRLAAAVARQRREWPRVVVLLEHLRANGQERDVHLLLDLAFARMVAGDRQGALAEAREAWRLQRSSRYVAQVYGTALKLAGKDGPTSRSLLAKARAMRANYRALPTVRYPFGNSQESEFRQGG